MKTGEKVISFILLLIVCVPPGFFVAQSFSDTRTGIAAGCFVGLVIFFFLKVSITLDEIQKENKEILTKLNNTDQKEK